MRSKRGKVGGKRADVQSIRAMLGQQQMTTSLGVVRQFAGEDSHWWVDDENGTNEIMVDVELIPSGEHVGCRLGFGNDGVYRIPRVNSEVAVLVPYNASSLIKDSLDYEAIIVGVLNVNCPASLDSDDIVVIDAVRVRVLSSNTEFGESPDPLDEVVVGSGTDPFTGSNYFALGNTSPKVKVKK